MSMPGSFPGTTPNVQSSRQRHSLASMLNPDTSLREADFVAKNKLCSKVDSQKSLIMTLTSTTYFLIGYLFLRYTHSSCLPPTIIQIFMQFVLQTWRATTASERDLFAEQLEAQELVFLLQGRHFNRRKIADLLLRQTCLLFYYSFFGVAIYHTLFYIFWYRPIALDGRQTGLEHGSWYGFTFVGESISTNILSSDSLLVQLWKLELPQVLIIDLAVLFLQLTLYQCIFMQSTISPKGIRLSEPDAFILTGQPGVPLNDQAHSDLIQIRLYETFQRENFSVTLD